jgi:rod shape-determining protein MreC
VRLLLVLRALGQRFSLLILVAASVIVIVLGKADNLLFERVRGGFADAASGILELASQPAAVVDAAAQRVHDLVALYQENARLRQENDRLLQWQQVAQTLAAENTRLRGLLNLVPEPMISFVTAKVIANSGGSFFRSVLVNAGNAGGVVRGQAAITGEGLVGRIAEVGERASRVLLVTDINSRIPVTVESSRERAVLAGDNSEQPRLIYLQPRSPVKVGDRIVTSGHGGVFPPGLPVGVVASTSNGIARVEPFVEMSRLDFVRIVDFGLGGVLPQPVQPIVRGRGKQASAQPAEDAR